MTRITTRWTMLVALIALACSLACAEEARAQTEDIEVSRFIDEATFLVARIDVAAIDVDALMDEITPIVAAAAAGEAERKRIVSDLDGGRAIGRLTLERLRGAGVSEAYVIGSFRAIGNELPLALIFPTTSDALGALLEELVGPYRVVDGSTIVGPPAAVRAMAATVPVARPTLEPAMAAAGDGVVRVAIIPADYTKNALRELSPELPDEFGGGDIGTLIDGFVWGAASIDAPPRPALRGIVRSPDRAAATELRVRIASMLKAFTEQPQVQARVRFTERVIASWTPEVTDEGLRLELGAEQLRMVGMQLTPVIRRSRMRAERMASMVQIRTQLTGCHIWAAEHNDAWPPDLDALIDSGYLSRENLINPSRPNQDGAYLYRKPEHEVARTAPGRVLIYEAHTEWPEGGIGVGFVDGHVELIEDENRFRELLRGG